MDGHTLHSCKLYAQSKKHESHLPEKKNEDRKKMPAAKQQLMVQCKHHYVSVSHCMCVCVCFWSMQFSNAFQCLNR